MNESSSKLTVYFDDPFWAGVFERIENGKLTVCKVMFGAEPKGCEVWAFVLKNHGQLQFGPPVDVAVKTEAGDPKRLRRAARKRTALPGIGTKAQQALQLQREENKLIRKTVSRQQREAEKQRLFELKQQKRKEKHKGR